MRRLVLVILFLSSVSIFAQTPAELWNQLKAGNDLFKATNVSDAALRALRDKMEAARRNTAGAQSPPVTILGCADSRVPPELVFMHTIGELFVVRTAGNVAGPLDIASIEYAIAPKPNERWTKLIVVLAHENCGAVEAALGLDNDERTLTPGLSELVTQIRRSFTAIPGWARGGANLRAATIANARQSANDLLAHSSVIRNAVRRGNVEIYTAYYTLSTGNVERTD